MDLGLSKRVALVCGASRGIGYAVAEELAREGAQVAICARDANAVSAAAARISQRQREGLPIVADLSTSEGTSSVVATMLERFGRVDVLVTNTGGPAPGPALSHDWAAWTRGAELLLRSAVELTRALVPGMQQRKWGRVIGITSITVKKPIPSLVLSNSLRAAVTGFYRTLADEVRARRRDGEHRDARLTLRPSGSSSSRTPLRNAPVRHARASSSRTGRGRRSGVSASRRRSRRSSRSSRRSGRRS